MNTTTQLRATWSTNCRYYSYRRTNITVSGACDANKLVQTQYMLEYVTQTLTLINISLVRPSNSIIMWLLLKVEYMYTHTCILRRMCDGSVCLLPRSTDRNLLKMYLRGALICTPQRIWHTCTFSCRVEISSVVTKHKSTYDPFNSRTCRVNEGVVSEVIMAVLKRRLNPYSYLGFWYGNTISLRSGEQRNG